MASPRRPLFSNTNHAIVQCHLRSSRTSPIPHGSPDFSLDNATFPTGYANQGSMGLASRFTSWPKSQIFLAIPQIPKANKGGGAWSLFTRLTPMTPALCVCLFQGPVAGSQTAAYPELVTSNHILNANQLRSPHHLAHVLLQTHLGSTIA